MLLTRVGKVITKRTNDMKSFKQLRESKPSTEDSDINEVFNQAQMKKAIGIARKSRGNYDKAYAEIEKIKKGLGDEDIIAHVLKKANESVELDESKLGDDKGLLKLAKGPSSKFPMGVGGPDRDDLIWAADMIKHNDIKGIQSHLGMLDTPVRDAVLKFVDKNTKTKLGYRDITYESVDLDEAVTVDMRTKGYKEAIARGLLKASKNVKKSEIDEILDAANKHIMGENEGMTAAGSDSTGAIDGYDKPLGKTKKRKSFKESIELEEGFRVVGVTTSGEKFKTGLLKTKKDADNKHWKLTKATDLRGKKVYKTLEVVKESVELDEAYDRGSIRDFKVGDKVKFVDDKSGHHGQTGKITKLIGGIGARQKAHVKLDKTKKTVIDILTSTDLIKESVEINEAVLDEGVSSEAKSVMREINKHLKILKTELKTSDENQDWKARLNRIEGIIGKVKWTVEESVELEEGVSLLKKGKYELTADGKSSVGVTLSLRHKGKQIITGTKKDGMFIMAFEKHNVRNKLPKGAEIVKKGKWMHIGFKKADDVIAYAKGQGFVADNKGVAESLVMQLVAKLKEK